MPLDADSTFMMNSVYRERFPKASCYIVSRVIAPSTNQRYPWVIFKKKRLLMANCDLPSGVEHSPNVPKRG